VILAEFDGLNKQLIDIDFTKINKNYFKHVDFVINQVDGGSDVNYFNKYCCSRKVNILN